MLARFKQARIKVVREILSTKTGLLQQRAGMFARKLSWTLNRLFSFSETRVTIHFGKAEDGSAQFISSSRIIPHSQYSAATKKYDIMLIKLESC